MDHDLGRLRALGRRGTASREAWRAQRVFAAREAIRVFMARPTYAALWDLRARLNELLEDVGGKKKFLWAALRRGRVLGTGTYSQVAAKAERAKNAVMWLVMDAFKPDWEGA